MKRRTRGSEEDGKMTEEERMTDIAPGSGIGTGCVRRIAICENAIVATTVTVTMSTGIIIEIEINATEITHPIQMMVGKAIDANVFFFLEQNDSKCDLRF